MFRSDSMRRRRYRYFRGVLLKLPRTLRTPGPEEMPGRSDLDDLLARRASARLVEGYRIRPNPTRQLPFSFYADINIDNDRLWDFMLALVQTMPDPLVLEYAMVPQEAVATERLPKARLLQGIDRFRKELSEDCRLSFGFAWLSRGAMVECAVTETKYIQYCGSNENEIRALCKQWSLPEEPGLAFADDFPRVTDPLEQIDRGALSAEEVIRELDRKFGVALD